MQIAKLFFGKPSFSRLLFSGCYLLQWNNLCPAFYSWSKATRDLLAIRNQAPYPIYEVLETSGIFTRSPE